MTAPARFRSMIQLAILVVTAGFLGCQQLGYSSRVLHRLPSPDGKLVAVCQEVPEFDGPGCDVRIEEPARHERTSSAGSTPIRATK